MAVLVGVPHSEAAFTTSPLNFLSERTLKGTFFGNYKPKTDLPGLVEKYLSKVKFCLLPNDFIELSVGRPTNTFLYNLFTCF